ncbi:hypothetical protein [Achromobacter piechaudii]|uniref:hypothetical protein n=1 Tax=Achromobacter piechaudii TaxID=72556 RepID=UPI000772F4FC|nr:hypothetical protein [Achromobacter piechaudii]
MKLRAYRRRQSRLSRGAPKFLDCYLSRVVRRDLDAGMAKLRLAMKKFGDALEAAVRSLP